MYMKIHHFIYTLFQYTIEQRVSKEDFHLRSFYIERMFIMAAKSLYEKIWDKL